MADPTVRDVAQGAGLLHQAASREGIHLKHDWEGVDVFVAEVKGISLEDHIVGLAGPPSE